MLCPRSFKPARYIVLDKWMASINIQVSRSKVNPIPHLSGKGVGGISVLQTSIFSSRLDHQQRTMLIPLINATFRDISVKCRPVAAVSTVYRYWSPRSYATEQSIQVDTASLRSKPGLKTPKKLWWLKEVTPDLHIAGRLTPRQIKYASEGGVKSIVSLYTYNEASKAGDDELPATQDAKRIAKKAGLNFSTVLPLKGKDEWASVKTVKKLGDILGGVSQPTIVHSDRGYSAAFVTLMHLAHRTRNDKDFKPRITSERFYTVAAVMGYDFTASNLKQIVAEVTGEPVVENPPKPNADIKDWYEYWYAAPVYKKLVHCWTNS